MDITVKNKIDFELVEEDVYLPIEKIKLRPEQGYQRAIEQPRKRRLKDSIQTYGYMKDKAIVLNEDYVVVEGQHRVLYFKEDGIKEVKCCVYKYATPEDEWLHFGILNNWNPSLGPKSFWHDRRGFKEPISILLYKLNQDQSCRLHNNIQLLGKEGNYKFKISQVLFMINHVLGLHHAWSRDRERFIYERMKDWEYRDLKYHIDLIVAWFNDCFGQYSEAVRTPYKADVFRALVKFYFKAHRQGKLHTDKGRQACVNKMRKLVFDGTFLRADEYGKVASILAFYNHQRNKKDYIRLED